MATLVGLLQTALLPATIAHEVKDRKENPAITLRTPGTHGNNPALNEEPVDAAIRTMLCLEARDAVSKGQLGGQGQQWILVNGHRCRDERLLFDALGF